MSSLALRVPKPHAHITHPLTHPPHPPSCQTLESWVSMTGGGFDLVVDDGGHTNMQLYNSFAVLFEKALKPGGLYVSVALLRLC